MQTTSLAVAPQQVARDIALLCGLCTVQGGPLRLGAACMHDGCHHHASQQAMQPQSPHAAIFVCAHAKNEA